METHEMMCGKNRRKERGSQLFEKDEHRGLQGGRTNFRVLQSKCAILTHTHTHTYRQFAAVLLQNKAALYAVQRYGGGREVMERKERGGEKLR